MATFWQNTLQFFGGLGYIPAPDAGNRGNAPALPPVQEGNYQFIQDSMLGGQGDNQDIVNVPVVPPAYQDWSEYALNEYGLSGLEGGGANAPGMPTIDNGPILFYDETTGLYVNLDT